MNTTHEKKTRGKKAIYHYSPMSRKMRRLQNTPNNGAPRSKVPKGVKEDVNYGWNKSKQNFLPIDRRFGGATSLANWIARGKPKTRSSAQRRRRRRTQRGGSPTTTWGSWLNAPTSGGPFGIIPATIQASANSAIPPPLANGGLYTGNQSTGPWASTPFPPTQWAHQLEAAVISSQPAVFLHQRPNDNFGASFSPAFSR